MKILLGLLYLTFSFGAIAQGILRSESPVMIREHALFVTHASKIFIDDQQVKEGIDQKIAAFKEKKLPVVYLMNEDDEEDSSWFTTDRNPDLALFSLNGSHRIPVEAREVTVTGGFFTLCFDRTVENIIEGKANGLTVNLPLDAIYEDKAIFMATENLKHEEYAFFFSVDGYRSLKFFKDRLSRQRFVKGIKLFFEYKKDLSYQVYLDGKLVLRNQVRGKRPIVFRFL